MLRLHIHPENPQQRLLQQAIQALDDGKIMIYQTDSCYVLGCKLEQKKAVEKISQILGLNDKYTFTLLCRDYSQISQYAVVSNEQYRLLKSHTPSEIAFILPASKETPKYLHNKQKNIAVRLSQSKICQDLMDLLNEPILACNLAFDDEILADPEQIELQLAKRVDLFLDSGYGLNMPSSVVDLSGDYPQVITYGLGDVSDFE